MISDHLYNFKIRKYRKSKMTEDPTKYNTPANRLDKFDAREARRLSEKSGANELQWVLNEIKRAAESVDNNDYSFITIKRKLRDSTLVELEKRGFGVTFLDQHAEHIIMW